MTKLTLEEEQELARLEQEFEEAGGGRIVSGSLFDGTEVLAGGNGRGNRIGELRAKRGDAIEEIEFKVRLTVRVLGEQMSEEELAAVLGPYGQARKLECLIADILRLNTNSKSSSIGYAPDGNREAHLDELVSVDYVEEVRR